MHGRKYYLRNITSALDALAERGHELVFAMSERKAFTRRVPSSLRGYADISSAVYPARRDDGLDGVQRLIRAFRDAARYETPELRNAHANRARAYRKLQEALAREGIALTVEPPEGDVDQADRAAFDAVLAAVDRLIPPSEPMRAFLRAEQLDVAVGITRVNFGYNEAGLVRAAQAGGVPVGLIVWSWDNLSSKGLLHEPPDRLFVWNELQARRGRRAPRARPRDGRGHGRAPLRHGSSRCGRRPPGTSCSPRTGLDPGRRTILYLGSSAFVDEVRAGLHRRAGFSRSAPPPSRRSGTRTCSSGRIPERPTSRPGRPGRRRTAPSPPPVVARAGAGPVRPALRRRRRGRAEHERRDRGGDRRPARAHRQGRATSRPARRAPPLLVPARRARAASSKRPGRSRSTCRSSPRRSSEDPLADARSRFLESFVRPRGLDRPAGPAARRRRSRRLASELASPRCCSTSSSSFFCTDGRTSASLSAIFAPAVPSPNSVAPLVRAVGDLVADRVGDRGAVVLDLDEVRARARGPAGASRW